MIRPLQKDDALLQDIASTPQSPERLDLWWLGQSGFLISWNGHSFLFDPYLSDSLTVKYAHTDKPHVRMTERCVDPARLTDLTLVTASHLHTDHLDAETLLPLAAANPGLPLFLPAAILADAQTRFGDASLTYHPLDHGVRHETPDWSMEGIAAAHNDLKVDDQGRHHYLGFVLRCGPFTLYHSGDTLWHDGLVETLRPLSCDLMLLPINGNRPERRVAGNLNGTEAAALAKACRARLVVPCHYDMFTFNTETPDEFVQACNRLQQPHQVLQCGERLSLRKNASLSSSQES
ncbi:L-ascorbate metabolism protein UlaG, beta-lactamase superfamily [Prosthecobacter debontii]|uniref:L-ascorbate metabolism protein UlaG, beta-lactamase superfamily n=1 Tax=Prosthecobacter debontii TaxID=48467 RepID=A0A1T4YFG0_9BACT|nr:MBL fold metallo-hydrolase [Prosthecobacter debontii]SKB00298.1 L-ascorbate metabolism protein UlaG, beta-lactamase superfamily [Prosthecobacter debontii]